MCGILALVAKNRADDFCINDSMQASFRSALASMKHRGPDSEGIYVSKNILFGHARLSIIDTSEKSTQPYFGPNKSSVLIYNGEIFNYIELRNKLRSSGCSFNSSGDTEVLIRGLDKYGASFISWLNGDWAFVYHNFERNETIISRDRFGAKPLFWAEDDNFFYFSSEPRGIYKISPSYQSKSDLAIGSFLMNNHVNVDRSFYKGINILPSSTYCVLSNGILKKTRYWNYPSRSNFSINRAEFQESFIELLEKSIELRLRSDVPVGITLSGGIDSSSVYSIASRKIKGINTLTSCFSSGNDECGWADRVILTPSDKSLHKKVYFPESDWIERLRTITGLIDSPVFSPAVIPYHELTKVARELGIKVLLEGQGADELLGGYPQYHANWMINNFSPLLSRFRFINAIRAKSDAFGMSYYAKWLMKVYTERKLQIRMKPRIKKFLSSRFYISIKPYLEMADYSKILEYDHSRNVLPSLLSYGDLISMVNSVESRQPFLDHRVVDHVFSFGGEYIFDDRTTKSALRSYLQTQGQHAIASRKDKLGYYVPLQNWLYNDKNKIKEILMESEFSKSNFRVEKILDSIARPSYNDAFHIFKLLTLALWLEC